VLRLCEAQDGGPSVTLEGLGLGPASLAPLLRALKLQAGLAELRLSGNRLRDDLLPELVATALTMPRLRVLDLSSNGVTGEGLEKVAHALRGQAGQSAFPVKATPTIGFITTESHFESSYMYMLYRGGSI